MNVDRITPPPAGRGLEVYRTFLRNLNAESRIWNRKLGRISWLQGCALREAKAVCRQGQWQDLLTTLDMKPTTAKYLRKIAELIPEPDSHTLTYTEMLTRCYPSYLTAVEQDLTAESAPTAGSKEPGNTPPTRSPQSQMVKTLTICLARLQRADASQVPTESEDTNAIATLLDQIEAQAARLRTAIAEKRIEPKLPPSYVASSLRPSVASPRIEPKPAHPVLPLPAPAAWAGQDARQMRDGARGT